MNVTDLETLFSEEREAFALRFRCASCAHVIPSTRACSMGYPNSFMRGPMRGFLADGIPVVCKYWELGETELDDPVEV